MCWGFTPVNPLPLPWPRCSLPCPFPHHYLILWQVTSLLFSAVEWGEQEVEGSTRKQAHAFRNRRCLSTLGPLLQGLSLSPFAVVSSLAVEEKGAWPGCLSCSSDYTGSLG